MATSKARAVIDAWTKKLGINSMGEVYLGGEYVTDMSVLLPRQKLLLKKWERVAPITTDLVRFYANGDKLTMNTEFCALLRDKEGWRAIKTFVKEMGMTMEEMETRKHEDKWKKNDGPWQTGPHHGKWERQVDCFVDITGLSITQVKKLKEELLAKAEQTGADKYWVSVI